MAQGNGRKKDWLRRCADRANAAILGVVDEIVQDPQGREVIRRSVLDSIALMEYRVRGKINLQVPDEDEPDGAQA